MKMLLGRQQIQERRTRSLRLTVTCLTGLHLLYLAVAAPVDSTVRKNGDTVTKFTTKNHGSVEVETTSHDVTVLSESDISVEETELKNENEEHVNSVDKTSVPAATIEHVETTEVNINSDVDDDEQLKEPHNTAVEEVNVTKSDPQETLSDILEDLLDEGQDNELDDEKVDAVKQEKLVTSTDDDNQGGQVEKIESEVEAVLDKSEDVKEDAELDIIVPEIWDNSEYNNEEDGSEDTESDVSEISDKSENNDDDDDDDDDKELDINVPEISDTSDNDDDDNDDDKELDTDKPEISDTSDNDDQQAELKDTGSNVSEISNKSEDNKEDELDKTESEADLSETLDKFLDNDEEDESEETDSDLSDISEKSVKNNENDLEDTGSEISEISNESKDDDDGDDEDAMEDGESEFKEPEIIFDISEHGEENVSGVDTIYNYSYYYSAESELYSENVNTTVLEIEQNDEMKSESGEEIDDVRERNANESAMEPSPNSEEVEVQQTTDEIQPISDVENGSEEFEINPQSTSFGKLNIDLYTREPEQTDYEELDVDATDDIDTPQTGEENDTDAGESTAAPPEETSSVTSQHKTAVTEVESAESGTKANLVKRVTYRSDEAYQPEVTSETNANNIYEKSTESSEQETTQMPRKTTELQEKDGAEDDEDEKESNEISQESDSFGSSDEVKQPENPPENEQEETELESGLELDRDVTTTPDREKDEHMEEELTGDDDEKENDLNNNETLDLMINTSETLNAATDKDDEAKTGQPSTVPHEDEHKLVTMISQLLTNSDLNIKATEYHESDEEMQSSADVDYDTLYERKFKSTDNIPKVFTTTQKSHTSTTSKVNKPQTFTTASLSFSYTSSKGKKPKTSTTSSSTSSYTTTKDNKSQSFTTSSSSPVFKGNKAQTFTTTASLSPSSYSTSRTSEPQTFTTSSPPSSYTTSRTSESQTFTTSSSSSSYTTFSSYLTPEEDKESTFTTSSPSSSDTTSQTSEAQTVTTPSSKDVTSTAEPSVSSSRQTDAEKDATTSSTTGHPRISHSSTTIYMSTLAPGYTCEDSNPCTSEMIVNHGFFYPHVTRTNFIQCGQFGLCFTVPCPHNTFWIQELVTCAR